MPAPLQIGEMGRVFTKRDVKRGDKPPGWIARRRVRVADGSIVEVLRRRPKQRDAITAVNEGVKEALAAAEVALAGPVVTVGEMLAEWLSTLDESGLAQSTIYTYHRNAARTLEGSDFAKLDLREVTPGMITGLLKEIATSSGRGEARTLRAVIRGVFDLAVEKEYLPANPLLESSTRLRMRDDNSTRARAKADDGLTTKMAFDEGELAAILNHVRESDLATRHNLAVLVHVLAGTGARIGEACALRWTDLDWTTGMLHIHGTVTRAKGVGVYVQPSTKTDAGMRRITLPRWLVDYLKEHRETHIPPSEFICASTVGTLRDPANTNKRMKDLLTEAGHGWATAHSFRKTVATILDKAGRTPREIAAHLGHRRPSMTQDVYMDPGREASTAGRSLDLVMAGGREGST